ncbi:flippase [Thermodesulfomicrobium sp. WS]|uniref:flippase n=1 Tax=Thermodesulfomicrobium sp. WS TaxID=3004129 RepID=UPI002490F1EE|nr:flippase [Thermodesulfomicrobium sp. WS]
MRGDGLLPHQRQMPRNLLCKGFLRLRYRFLSLSSYVSRFTSHPDFRRYAVNTNWLFAEKVLRMILGFFVGVLVARYLGPERYGLFSYAQSFVALFTPIASLGLDNIVVRELVKEESRRDELLGTAFWLKIIGAVTLLILLSIAVNLTSNDTDTNTLVFIIALGTIFQSFNVIDMYFQSKVMGKYITYANAVALMISSATKVSLILFEAPLIAFVWTVVFDGFLLAIGYVWFYTCNYVKLSIRNWRFNLNTARAILKDALPLMLGGFSFVVFSNIDSVMIKEIIGDFGVGVYNSAYRLVTLWYFLPGLVLYSLMPWLVKKHQNLKLFYDALLFVSTLLVWLAIAIFFIYVSLGEVIIQMVYSERYADAAQLVSSMAAVNLLIFFNSVWNYWMIIENKAKRIMLFHWCVALLNIIFNYFLIHKFGVAGAIYALLSSLLIVYCIFGFRDKRMLKLILDSLSLKILWKTLKN